MISPEWIFLKIEMKQTNSFLNFKRSVSYLKAKYQGEQVTVNPVPLSPGSLKVSPRPHLTSWALPAHVRAVKASLGSLTIYPSTAQL